MSTHTGVSDRTSHTVLTRGAGGGWAAGAGPTGRVTPLGRTGVVVRTGQGRSGHADRAAASVVWCAAVPIVTGLLARHSHHTLGTNAAFLGAVVAVLTVRLAGAIVATATHYRGDTLTVLRQTGIQRAGIAVLTDHAVAADTGSRRTGVGLAAGVPIAAGGPGGGGHTDAGTRSRIAGLYGAQVAVLTVHDADLANAAFAALGGAELSILTIGAVRGEVDTLTCGRVAAIGRTGVAIHTVVVTVAGDKTAGKDLVLALARLARVLGTRVVVIAVHRFPTAGGDPTLVGSCAGIAVVTRRAQRLGLPQALTGQWIATVPGAGIGVITDRARTGNTTTALADIIDRTRQTITTIQQVRQGLELALAAQGIAGVGRTGIVVTADFGFARLANTTQTLFAHGTGLDVAAVTAVQPLDRAQVVHATDR